MVEARLDGSRVVLVGDDVFECAKAGGVGGEAGETVRLPPVVIVAAVVSTSVVGTLSSRRCFVLKVVSEDPDDVSPAQRDI